MKKHHEQLLVATLAGLIIAGAATFAVQPALASTNDRVRVTDVNTESQFQVARVWPANYSKRTGGLQPMAYDHVEPEAIAAQGADRCLFDSTQQVWADTGLPAELSY
jgi:hypothetical protein